MAADETDVFIAGGGIAGLTAALAFAEAGFSVILADPGAPPGTESAKDDLRSTAFLQPAQALFARIGLWDALGPLAAPLQALRVVDTTGWPPKVAEARTFDAADLGDAPFGWNLPNRQTRAAAHRAALAHPRVTLGFGAGFEAMLTRTTGAHVTLTDGRRIVARLVVGADGRASPVRGAAGIAVATRRYGQKALAFSVTHALAHGNVSTEIYHAGGAFTTVPLKDHQGQPASAIVWMNDGRKSLDLASLSLDDLGTAATERSAALLGAMTAVTEAQVWPVVTQTARRLTAERTALVAEAAHVLPPIGAQGLNTSLHDVAALIDAAGDPARLGDPGMLAAYERARARDIALRARAIDAFNRLCRSGAPAAHAMRQAGLRAIHDLPPLRRQVMRAGLGT